MNYSEDSEMERSKQLRDVFDRTDGMISFEEAVLLYRLAKKARNGCILEIGSYRGRSTVFLGKGSLDGAGVPVFAVDPHTSFVGILGGVFGSRDRTAFYEAMLLHNCSEIVSLINLSSEAFSSQWSCAISLLWIDGDHRYEGVRRDFDCWERYLLPGSFIAFDDALDSSLGPLKVIEELIGSGSYLPVARVGKIVVLCRANNESLPEE